MVDLETGTATGTGGITNINGLIGSPGNDTLIGPNLATNWLLTGTNSGTIPGVALFVDFENLTGGSDDDTFIFSDGMGVTGTIDGGDGYDIFDYSAYTTSVVVNLNSSTATGTGGFTDIEEVIGGTASDTLIGPNLPNIWNILGADTGNISGGMEFSSVENLNGGSEDDTFVFSAIGSSISGQIDGQGGSNTLDYHDYPAAVVVDLSIGTATGTGGISNIQIVIGSQTAANSLTGNDEDNILVGGNVFDFISGGGGSDIILGGDGGDFLIGGGGRDILVGGGGGDLIGGGDGDDILISGTTSYDDVTNPDNLIAWGAFRTEWNSSNLYLDRINNIKVVGVGPYNDTLDPGVTVFDDAVADFLTGGSDDDWFFVGAGDLYTPAAGEQVEIL
jgi:Ca2+-binding RTX toxin-like protein